LSACRIEWPLVSAEARKNLKKPFTPEQLIEDEDAETVKNYLKDQMRNSAPHALSQYKFFRQLQTSCLAYIILWNKRRSGETSKASLTVVDDMVKGIWKRDSEIQKLDPAMRVIADSMSLTFIKG
jgi:hypothetical protein